MCDCRKDANLQSDLSVNSTVPRAIHAVINVSGSCSMSQCVLCVCFNINGMNLFGNYYHPVATHTHCLFNLLYDDRYILSSCYMINPVNTYKSTIFIIVDQQESTLHPVDAGCSRRTRCMYDSAVECPCSYENHYSLHCSVMGKTIV